MTEIPEHLLKRSKERRAAIGGGGDAGGDAPAAEPTSASTEVAPAAEAPTSPAAPPAPVEPEPPKPLPSYIQAAQSRRRIPFWAMPVLAALPLWAYVYTGTLEPPPAGENDPLVLGREGYSSCASCHGGGGGGGVGPALRDGAVVETWPDFRDHMMWVRLGDEGWPSDEYGAQGTAKGSGMPGHPDLTDAELAQIILYERVGLGGEEADAEQLEMLTAIANGELTFAEAGLGPLSEDAGVPESALESGAG